MYGNAELIRTVFRLVKGEGVRNPDENARSERMREEAFFRVDGRSGRQLGLGLRVWGRCRSRAWVKFERKEKIVVSILHENDETSADVKWKLSPMLAHAHRASETTALRRCDH